MGARPSKGMRPEHARYLKDQRGSGGRSPDGSASLFRRRGDDWQTQRDSIKEFGIQSCPCCGQAVNPEMDQFTKATRANVRHALGPDKPLQAKGDFADPERLAWNAVLKMKAAMKKAEGR